MQDEERNEREDAGVGRSAFEEAASGRRLGLLTEFLGFLGENKKWWLLPIILALLALGGLMLLSATGAGPFLYSTF